MALKTVQYDDFSGSLNTLGSQSKIKDNESPNMWNVEIIQNGIPSKRRGGDNYGDEVDSRVTGLASLYLANGTKSHLRTSATKLYKMVANAWSEISGVTFTTNLQTNFVMARNALYIHNGTDQMSKFDGTTLSSVITGVVGKFGIYYGSMHVIAGNSDNPSRLYLSSAQDAEDFTFLSGTATAGGASTLTDSGQSWVVNKYQNISVTIVGGTGTGQSRTISSNTSTQLTVSSAWVTNPDNTSKYIIGAGNTLDIAKDDGQKITGLGKFEDRLIVFKERSSYQVVFDTSGYPAVALVNGSVGCVSHRSIEAVENDLFYLANDGIRTFGYVVNIPNVIRTNKLSSKIDNIIGNINGAYAENACAIYHDNKYMLSFPYGASTTNNRIVVFQLLYGSWTQWGDIQVNCFNQFIDTDSNEKLYYGSDDSGYVVEFLKNGVYNDSGVAINAYWYSKQYALNTFSITKRIKHCDVQMRALTGVLSMDFIVDGVSNAKTATISSTFSNTDGYRASMYRELMYREDVGSTANLVATDDVRRIKLLKKGITIQVKASNNRLSESFALMGLAFGMKPMSPNTFNPEKIIY